MSRYLLSLVGLFLLCLPLLAAPAEPGWFGLTGLYTQPTAETIPLHHWAITFSETRFKEQNDTTNLHNTMFVINVTTTPLPRWEVAGNWHHEILRLDPLGAPDMGDELNRISAQFHVKYVIVEPGPRKVGLAVGVQDVTNASEHIDGLDTERGRRVFFVGTLDWASAGISYNDNNVGAFIGGRLEVSENIDLVAEMITNPLYVRVLPHPSNSLNFNLGVRMHPRQVPNLHVDLAAIGDGEFDFGFALGYTFRY